MLTLPIKRQWFDMILMGLKTEEYREIKPYYTKRFIKFVTYAPIPDEIAVNVFRKADIPFHNVVLKNGYQVNAPAILINGTITIGTGRPEWGAVEGEEYYILKITESEVLNPGWPKDRFMQAR